MFNAHIQEGFGKPKVLVFTNESVEKCQAFIDDYCRQDPRCQGEVTREVNDVSSMGENGGFE